MADKGHYRTKGGSRQGIYVLSPSGKLLSSVNSLNPDVVLDVMKEGLIKWNALPKKQKKLPKNFDPKTLTISHVGSRGEGISKLGELVDLGVKAEIIDKSGSWFAYKNTKIGQGRENVKNFLNDNPSIAKEIENQILENAGIVEKAMMEGKVESKEKEKEEIKD